ncbi:hypothetical protein [Plantactinospora sp. B5E13]|uniref:hypothetical protein n=1 Tax=unclassified Plantactinospora TaxID=2631981 RepID=UPI00325D541B
MNTEQHGSQPPLRVAAIIASTRTGRFGEHTPDVADTLLRHRTWWGQALLAARTAQPYPA